jgi:hypothetical protein
MNSGGGRFGGNVPTLFLRQHGLHDVFQFVRTLYLIGIIVRAKVKRGAVPRANRLQFFIEPKSDAFGIQTIGFRENQAEQIVGKPVDGIGGAQFLGHRLGRVAESGLPAVERSRGAGLRFDKDERKIFFHAVGAAKFHGEAIPEVILVGHGFQEIRAGLNLQFDVALEFRERLLFDFGEGALTVEQIADEENGESAKTEESGAQCPSVAFRVKEDERVHQSGEAARQDKDKDGGEDCELKATSVKMIELLTVDRGHSAPIWGSLSQQREAGKPPR